MGPAPGGPTGPPGGPSGPQWSGPTPPRNKTPWIIGGAIAAALVLVLAIAAASGGGGGDGGDDEAGRGSGSGYDDATHENFDNVCSNYPGATKSICDCIWGKVVDTVPYDTYHEFEQQVADDPETPLPSFITGVISECS
jgi:hypothetical protein